MPQRHVQHDSLPLDYAAPHPPNRPVRAKAVLWASLFQLASCLGVVLLSIINHNLLPPDTNGADVLLALVLLPSPLILIAATGAPRGKDRKLGISLWTWITLANLALPLALYHSLR